MRVAIEAREGFHPSSIKDFLFHYEIPLTNQILAALVNSVQGSINLKAVTLEESTFNGNTQDSMYFFSEKNWQVFFFFNSERGFGLPDNFSSFGNFHQFSIKFPRHFPLTCSPPANFLFFRYPSISPLSFSPKFQLIFRSSFHYFFTIFTTIR